MRGLRPNLQFSNGAHIFVLLECKVDVPRVRIDKRQAIETLINEKALLLAKFLRNERENWIPRIGMVL